MSYLDNIKALATELASMAPRTQMELIKLCKDLCINTKNYLVAFDETTLPALDARIEALESLTSDLSNELSVAEDNITANANAISTIQDAISTIETALSNVYTKSQIDTMLASYYTKSQIDTMFASYYNKTEVDTALSGKADKSTTYTKTEVDNALADKQATLVSGTNIKTINNTSLLGSGNIEVGGSQLYKHNITLKYVNQQQITECLITLSFINRISTAYTNIVALFTYLANQGFTYTSGLLLQANGFNSDSPYIILGVYFDTVEPSDSVYFVGAELDLTDNIYSYNQSDVTINTLSDLVETL